MQSAKPETIDFLIVEDSEEHLELIQFTLRKAAACGRIDSVRDGEAALEFLRASGEWKHRKLPHMIILDINLPKLNGLEVLEIIKNDDELLHIPIVLLTTSEANRDRAEAYRKGVNSYLVKPFDFTEFKSMIASLVEYWGQWNRVVDR